ncbi:MAG: hypothetical protein QM765_31510 [Myxococcales bacterium]
MRTLPLTLGLLALVGCSSTVAGAPDSGGSEASEDAGPSVLPDASIPPITTPSELAAAINEVSCGLYVECGTVADLATCNGAFQSEKTANWVQALAYVQSGKLTFNSANATACVEVMKTLACENADTFRQPSSPCNHYFQGTIPEGGDCQIDWECLDGLRCSKTCSEACCKGKCAPNPGEIVQAGGECGLYTQLCAWGTFCRSESPKKHCRAEVAAGASCTFKDVCVAGYLCTATETAAGTCTKKPKAGESCLTIDVGMGVTQGRCAVDAYCDKTSNKCLARKAPGASCAEGHDEQCQGYGQCVGTPAKCVAAPKAGESCGATDQPSCLLYLDCVNGTCGFKPVTTCP